MSLEEDVPWQCCEVPGGLAAVTLGSVQLLSAAFLLDLPPASGGRGLPCSPVLSSDTYRGLEGGWSWGWGTRGFGSGGQDVLEGVPWVPPQAGHCAVLLCPHGDGQPQRMRGCQQETAPRHRRPWKHISKTGSRAEQPLPEVSSSINSPEKGSIVCKSFHRDELIQWWEAKFQENQRLSTVCESVIHPDKELPHRGEKKLWHPPNMSTATKATKAGKAKVASGPLERQDQMQRKNDHGISLREDTIQPPSTGTITHERILDPEVGLCLCL